MTRDCTPEELEIFQTIPGVRVFGPRTAHAPIHAAWLLEDIAAARRIPLQLVSHPPPQRKYTFADIEACSTLREWVPKFLTAYQRDGILTVLNAPQHSGLLWHPTGSGKSLEGIVWSCVLGGPTIVVTKAAARKTLWREFKLYSTIEPLILKPKVERRKADPEYTTAELAKHGVVIVGWEQLPEHIDLLLSIGPQNTVYDEIHKGMNHRRYAAIPGTDSAGRDTKTFERLDNISANAARLSANTHHRLGMTATPIPDRRRNLWAQLDLIFPGEWGRYWDWAKRYCDLTTNTWGGLDDRGKSNTAELNQRLRFFVHKVDYAVTHRDLPPKRRLPTYLAKAQQSPPGAFARELERAKKLGSKSLLEVKLAEAASRKRGYIVERVKDTVGGGAGNGKVVIFTGRHADCERLGEAIRKALPDSVPVWVAHGGHGVAFRDEIQELYMGDPTKGTKPHPGPCVLVGTGDAWGESYQLQDTDLALMAMLPITPKQLWQREGRFYRHGQTRPCLTEYVIAEGTVDEHVSTMLLEKLPAVEEVTGDSDVGKAHRDLMGVDDQTMIQRLCDAVLQSEDPLADELALMGVE